LQEPLRAIRGFARLLKDHHAHQLDAQGREYLAFVLDGAQRMRTLIDHLLEYSRVRMQGQPLEETDSEQALQAALDNLRGLLHDRKARVTSSGLCPVMADASQLTQVFQNLIGNAVKFCQAEVPEVVVHAEPDGEQVVFSVRDNGIGIDPRDHERIFSIFQRLHTADAYPGTGLGLAICQQIVKRHQGRIWVESVPGEGSTFLFTLPRAASRA
jgi:light-regulated signal transduction histidine kinase (bacteriophytochrome)